MRTYNPQMLSPVEALVELTRQRQRKPRNDTVPSLMVPFAALVKTRGRRQVRVFKHAA